MTMLTAHDGDLINKYIFIPSRHFAVAFLPTIREIFNSDTMYRYQVHVPHDSYDLLIIQKRHHQYQHAANITCIQHTLRVRVISYNSSLVSYEITFK